MIELLDLSKWKKQKDIILELHREWGVNITPREWRSQVEKWNKNWGEGKTNFCITHSNVYGYKATTDVEEAFIAINDFRSRRKKMAANEQAIINGFRLKAKHKLDEEMEKTYENNRII